MAKHTCGAVAAAGRAAAAELAQRDGITATARAEVNSPHQYSCFLRLGRYDMTISVPGDWAILKMPTQVLTSQDLHTLNALMQ